ncbi:MAG: hypothetical protein IJ088_12400, partial [Clostridia bacterium]|nr:hypothetical protein [Clostridia bacterium]
TFIPHKNVGVQSLWISKLYAHQLHSTWFTQFVVKAFILAHSIFGGTPEKIRWRKNDIRKTGSRVEMSELKEDPAG